MVSVKQDSHRGHQVGLPKKQTLRLILACKSLSKSATGIKTVEEKAASSCYEGPRTILADPSWGGLQPSIAVLSWDEKAGICILWTYQSWNMDHLGKGCGLRQGNCAAETIPKGTKDGGPPARDLPSSRGNYGPSSDIWVAYPSSHHRDLNPASFPSTVLSMLGFLILKRSLNAHKILPASKYDIPTQENTK